MSELNPSRAGTGRHGEKSPRAEAAERPEDPPPQIQAVPGEAEARAEAHAQVNADDAALEPDAPKLPEEKEKRPESEWS